MAKQQFDEYLDATAYNCPMPLLKTKQALRYMAVESILKVVTCDAGSVRDFSAFVEHSNHRMLDMYEQQDKYYYFIEKHD
jgi:TusA-related sulfurtransferase